MALLHRWLTSKVNLSKFSLVVLPCRPTIEGAEDSWGVSKYHMGVILHEIMGMRKLSSHRDPLRPAAIVWEHLQHYLMLLIWDANEINMVFWSSTKHGCTRSQQKSRNSRNSELQRQTYSGKGVRRPERGRLPNSRIHKMIFSIDTMPNCRKSGSIWRKQIVLPPGKRNSSHAALLSLPLNLWSLATNCCHIHRQTLTKLAPSGN